MKITIVILNYNGIRDTLECLDSIKKCTIGTHQIKIIIVDNNSTDTSLEKLSKLKDINLIVNNDNLGYSGGMNTGIKKALEIKSDAVILLNNDTIADPNLIVELAKASNNAQIISPKIYFAPGYEFHKSRYKKSELGKVIWYAGAYIDWDNIIGRHIGVDEVDNGKKFNSSKSIDLATGACMLIKSEVFKKIGFFNENYFLYLEDMDFSVRAIRSNFKIKFAPKAILWHKNALSAGGSGSQVQDYYISRNRLLFASKYAKLRTKFALLRQIILQINNPIKRKALTDFLTFNFGKAQIQ